MWEFSEGDTKFLCTMKVVPLEDLGFSGARSVKVLEPLKASSLLFLSVARCLKSEQRRLKRRRRKKPLQTHQNKVSSNFLDMYDK